MGKLNLIQTLPLSFMREIREFDGGFIIKLDELDKAQGEMTFRVHSYVKLYHFG
jgi:hypothetical protein